MPSDRIQFQSDTLLATYRPFSYDAGRRSLFDGWGGRWDGNPVEKVFLLALLQFFHPSALFQGFVRASHGLIGQEQPVVRIRLRWVNTHCFLDLANGLGVFPLLLINDPQIEVGDPDIVTQPSRLPQQG